jgi:hypothetical protein
VTQPLFPKLSNQVLHVTISYPDTATHIPLGGVLHGGLQSETSQTLKFTV